MSYNCENYILILQLTIFNPLSGKVGKKKANAISYAYQSRAPGVSTSGICHAAGSS